MKTWRFLTFLIVAVVSLSCTSSNRKAPANANSTALENAQVPSWSKDDLSFFLHGSMSTEFVPERVLQAFMASYPDAFPGADLTVFGLVQDATAGIPVGLSRREVHHLGGLPSLGMNCAACHVGEVVPAEGGKPARIFGMTALFDAEAFFAAIIGSTFRTVDPANMKRFLGEYLAACDSQAGLEARERLMTEWQRQEKAITALLTSDPGGAKGAAVGALHEISSTELRLDRQRLEQGVDLPALCQSFLKLFHNMRAALHVPDQAPTEAPPHSGPGRNDAFGLLSALFFGEPQPYAPVKYGLAWNLENRRWVHWDGNTQSPIGRNLLAALGLGAPLLGKKGHLDFTALQRHTELAEKIRPPRYPFSIDMAAANRGATHYKALCASCHDGPESDRRLYAVEEIGTDPQRARLFTQKQADRFNDFLAGLEIDGYKPSSHSGIRGTQKYWAASMAGVWARSPYLHNGSVRTMAELLTAPPKRARSFHRGSRIYDTRAMGYQDSGPFVLDTTTSGNSNAGHDFGSSLSPAAKRDLIEHLKTL